MRLSIVLLAAALAVFTRLSAQEDEERFRRAPSAAELAGYQVRAEELLRDTAPGSGSGMEPAKALERAEGTVRWGRLFEPQTAVALVNLALGKDEHREEPSAEPLLWYIWREGRWEFRSFLARVSKPEVHVHRGVTYLEAAGRWGRFEGEFASWRYEAAKKELVRTKFEEWGPVYLAGDYLVTTRGFERLAHWTTYCVYDFRKGRKGALLAMLHMDDESRFTVTFPKRPGGALVSWGFAPQGEDEERYRVYLEKQREDLPAREEKRAPLGELRTGDDFSPENVFQQLTGLSRHLLQETWRDGTPPPAPVGAVVTSVQGAAELKARFPVRAETSATPERPRFEPPVFTYSPEVEARVQALVAEVKWKGPAPAEPVKIWTAGARGYVGTLFGDERLAALVAVELRSDQPGELCLLLWQEGAWKLQQRVGQVPPNQLEEWDWALHRRVAGGECYVCGGRQLYPPRQHLSWRCDSKTGQAVPTGWRTDALPAATGETVTFAWEKKPGYSPLEYSIHRLDQPAGAPLVMWQTELLPDRTEQIRITTYGTAGAPTATWAFRQKPGTQQTVYTIAHSASAGEPAPAQPETTIELEWAKYPHWTAAWLIQRLTGLPAAAVLGQWGGDADRRELNVPKSARVTGIGEAVAAFTWPPPDQR